MRFAAVKMADSRLTSGSETASTFRFGPTPGLKDRETVPTAREGGDTSFSVIVSGPLHEERCMERKMT
jgi:hypothetical protein